MIYTGGTIGMMHDPETDALKPFNFKALTQQMPELQKFNIKLFSYFAQKKHSKKISIFFFFVYIIIKNEY